MNTISWIKTHKLVCILVVIIFYFASKDSLFGYKSTSSVSSLGGVRDMSFNVPQKMVSMPSSEIAPSVNISNRLVTKDTSLSLQVSKVDDTQKKIIQKTQEWGGYMVNSFIENPSDVASGTVVVRIPSAKLEEALSYFRSLSIKVVSENLQGQDVTDQYSDLDAQLQTYLKTKSKFEEMLDKAVLVQDILEVQREIISVQNSIDSIKGQQDYLKKSVQLTKITMYLSTDDLALPYAPTETWRPEVIFKQAVRSVVGTARSVGSLIIWVAVYSVVWVPVIVIIFILKRKKKDIR